MRCHGGAVVTHRRRCISCAFLAVIGQRISFAVSLLACSVLGFEEGARWHCPHTPLILALVIMTESPPERPDLHTAAVAVRPWRAPVARRAAPRLHVLHPHFDRPASPLSPLLLLDLFLDWLAARTGPQDSTCTHADQRQTRSHEPGLFLFFGPHWHYYLPDRLRVQPGTGPHASPSPTL